MTHTAIKSAIRFTFSLLLGSVLPSLGCGDPAMTAPGNVDTEMPVTLLTPQQGFLGRSMKVQISTLGTHFTTMPPRVFFGDGVTVTNTVTNSDDSLTVSIDIASTAKPSLRDVVIDLGQEVRTTLKSAFQVSPELVARQVSSVSSGPQGGLVNVDFRNDDYVLNPFVSRNALSFTQGLNAWMAGNVSFGIGYLSGFALIDPLATLGPADVQLTGTSPVGLPVTYYSDPADPLLPKVTARTATPITLGSPTSADFQTPASSNFYTFDNATANSVMVVVADQGTLLGSANQGATSLIGAVAPQTGLFKDGQALDSVGWRETVPMVNNRLALLALLKNTGKHYLTLFPQDLRGGATGNAHTLNVKLMPTATFSTVEPSTPDTNMAPLATLTGLTNTTAQYSSDGAIDFPADTDFIRYSYAATGYVYLQVNAPGATSLQLQTYSDANCTSFAQAATFRGGVSGQSSVVTQLSQVQTAGSAQCFTINASGPKYPIPYTVIITR